MTVTLLSIRREQGMKLADFSTGHGLEIGPLNQPLVNKDMADVGYVDVFSGSHLRAHYAQDPNVNVQDIPDIDFVLSTPDGWCAAVVRGGRSRSSLRLGHRIPRH